MVKLNFPAKDLQDAHSLSFVNVIKSVFLSYAITIICLLIFAFIITYTNFPEGIISTIVLLITILSIAFSGMLVARSTKCKGWLSGAVAGVTYMFTLYCIGSLVFQSFSFGVNLLIMLALGLFSGTFGGIVGINMKSYK